MGTFQGDNEQDLKAKQVLDIFLTNCFSSNPFEHSICIYIYTDGIVKMEIFPKEGVKIKHAWHHHLG